MEIQKVEVEKREREAAQNNRENIELRRKEETERAKVYREVLNYRKMMEGMGKGEKLAPLDAKTAAQEYDDRLAMTKTLEEQEEKMKLNERNMMKLNGEDSIDEEQNADEASVDTNCRCIIS